MTLVHLWHAACWVALQTLPPRRAANLVGRVGGRLRTWSRSDALRYAGALRGGTCLSRSMTIASRLPGARVAIGPQPDATPSRFFAHAWVEVAGKALIPSEVTGTAIAYLSVSRAGNEGLVHVCSDREVFDA